MLVHSEEKNTDLSTFEKNLIFSLSISLRNVNPSITKSEFYEALPYFPNCFDLEDLKDTTDNLGIDTYIENEFDLKNTHISLENSLYLKDNEIYCLIKDKSSCYFFLIKDNHIDKKIHHPQSGGTLITFKKKNFNENPPRTSLFSIIDLFVKENKDSVIFISFVSFLYNLSFLSLPFYIRFCYDSIMSSQSISTLLSVSVGAFSIACFSYTLHTIKLESIEATHNKFHKSISRKMFKKILNFNIQSISNASISSQISRIMEFNNFSQNFILLFCFVFFDLPFSLIFLGVFSLFLPGLFWIPMLSIAIYTIGVIIYALFHKSISEDLKQEESCQDSLIESLGHLKDIKLLHAEDLFFTKILEKKSTSIINQEKLNILSQKNQSFMDAITMISGYGVIALGSIQVMSGTHSPGALISGAILIWRILSPFKLSFTMVPKFLATTKTLSTISRLFAFHLKQEKKESFLETRMNLKGSIQIEEVSYRNPSSYNHSLSGVNLDIHPGDIVSFVGLSGSGKTTLLQLIAQLTPIQSGHISLDQHDIKQFDPKILRKNISYLPENPVLFFGKLKQNIFIAHPTITDQELSFWSDHLNLSQDIDNLEHGWNTFIDDWSEEQHSHCFRQKINLMRAFARQSKIILLEEPGAFLDPKTDQCFMELLKKTSGKRTVIMVTSRPSHWRISDKVVYFKNGRIVAQGPPDQWTDKIMKDMS